MTHVFHRETHHKHKECVSLHGRLAVSPHLSWKTLSLLLCTSFDTGTIFLTWKNGRGSGFPHLIALYVLIAIVEIHPGIALELCLRTICGINKTQIGSGGTFHCSSQTVCISGVTNPARIRGCVRAARTTFHFPRES